MTFDALGLNDRMLKALAAENLVQPTPVQTAMIPPALAGRDVQASAETGSGKTAAFLLPLIQQLAERSSPRTDTRALIILPTRELAQQISRTCELLTAFTQIKSELITGGSGFQEQQARLRKNPEIVIGTPGRLLEHLQKGSMPLGDVEVLVLDEADRMLDMGFREDVLELVNACPKKRQTMLLSATLEHLGLKKIAADILTSPEVIRLGSHREGHEQIHQQYILADDNGHKRQLLVWLLAHQSFEKVLIFTNTRDYAEALRRFLQEQHVKAGCLHGEMPHAERKKVMQRFRNESLPVLVATDLAARGLDISGVDFVINFHLARSGDDFVHRTGRTGRAGKQGVALSLVSPQEWNGMQSIMRYLSLEPEKREVDGMVARFAGEPSRKPKTTKKKPAPGKSNKREPEEKAKTRHRNSKNIGKRRKPATEGVKKDESGYAPLKKKS